MSLNFAININCDIKNILLLNKKLIILKINNQVT